MAGCGGTPDLAVAPLILGIEPSLKLKKDRGVPWQLSVQFCLLTMTWEGVYPYAVPMVSGTHLTQALIQDALSGAQLMAGSGCFSWRGNTIFLSGQRRRAPYNWTSLKDGEILLSQTQVTFACVLVD